MPLLGLGLWVRLGLRLELRLGSFLLFCSTLFSCFGFAPPMRTLITSMRMPSIHYICHLTAIHSFGNIDTPVQQCSGGNLQTSTVQTICSRAATTTRRSAKIRAPVMRNASAHHFGAAGASGPSHRPAKNGKNVRAAA